MSPTYLSLQMAAAEKRAEKARQAGDLSEMQDALAEMTSLISEYHGRPQHPSLKRPVGPARM